MNPHIKVAAETEDGLLLDINLVPFGGPFQNRSGKGCDLDGEFFTEKTDLCLQLNPAKSWPLLYHHGHDDDIKVDVLGTFGEPVKQVDGFWVQAQIDANSDYLEHIKELVRQGKLFASSGALNYLVETKSDGEIGRWPLMEGSLTPTPSNLLARVTEKAVASHFKSAGYDWAGLKAVWSTAFVNDLPDSAFLYIEDGGSKDDDGKTKPRSLRHFPYKDKDGKVDLPHLRNALARIPQSSLPDDVKSKVLAKAKRIAKANGIDSADDDGKAAPPYFRPVSQRRTGSSLPPPRRAGLSQDTDGYTDYSGQPVSGITDSRMRRPRGRGDVSYSQSDDGMSIDPGKAAKNYYGNLGTLVEASFEDLSDDICELLNSYPRGPIEADGYYYSLEATIPSEMPDGVAIVKVCGGDDDDDLYEIPYSIGDDGEPMLGTPRAVSLSFTPGGDEDDDETKSYETPLVWDIAAAERANRYAATVTAALAVRTKDHCETRAKEGRVLSSATRQRLQTLVEAVKNGMADLEDLLATTEPPAKADPARVRSLELKHRHYAHLLEDIA